MPRKSKLMVLKKRNTTRTCKKPSEILGSASKGLLIYFVLPDVHVFEMCFTFSTVNVACCCAAPGVPGVGLGAFEAVVVDPVIATS